MSEVLPTGTPMGVLRLHEVYIEHDGPRLFSCANDAGKRFFGVFVDEDDNAETFLYAAVDEPGFWAVRSGRLPLRSVFQRPADGGVFVVRSSLVELGQVVTWRGAAEVPDDWLPAPDARLGLATAPQSEDMLPGMVQARQR